MNTTTIEIISRVYRAGSIQIPGAEIAAAVKNGKRYVIGHRQIWEIQLGPNGYRLAPVYRERGPLPIMVRGRFGYATPAEASKLSKGLILPE